VLPLPSWLDRSLVLSRQTSIHQNHQPLLTKRVKVLPAQRVRQARKDHLDLKDHKDPKVIREPMETRAILVSKVYKELKVHKGFLVRMVRLGHRVCGV